MVSAIMLSLSRGTVEVSSAEKEKKSRIVAVYCEYGSKLGIGLVFYNV